MTDLDKKIRYILLYAYYQGKDDKGYSDTQIDNDMNAIKSLIKEEAERHADECIGTFHAHHCMYDTELGCTCHVKSQRQRNNYQVTDKVIDKVMDKAIERIESDE